MEQQKMAQETCGQQELTEQELSEVAGGGILSAVKGLFKGGKAAKQGAEAAKKGMNYKQIAGEAAVGLGATAAANKLVPAKW